MITPYLPLANNATLNELSIELTNATRVLGSMLHPNTARSVAKSLNPAHAYYLHQLQGNSISLSEIEGAIHQDFSIHSDTYNLQLESNAIINSIESMRNKMLSDNTNPATVEFLCALHENMHNYSPQLKTAPPLYNIGKLRTYQLKSDWHTPPQPETLQNLFNNFSLAYKPTTANSLLAKPCSIASAHHRLALLQPFAYGNEKTLCLFTQAMCIAHGLDAKGLWSLPLALHRNQADYITHLRNAARARFDSNDGRDELSLKSLTEYCKFFIRAIYNEVSYMIAAFQHSVVIPKLLQLIEELNMRPEAKFILKEIWYAGSIAKADVKRITGKSINVSLDVARQLVESGLIKPDNRPKNSSYYLNIPAKHLPLFLNVSI